MPDHPPIPPGKGRLLARALDGTGAPCRVWVAVEPSGGGDATGQFTGESEACIDLAPGDYEVTLRFSQPETWTVHITAGQAQVVQSTPRGRLLASATDGTGAPTRVWVAVEDDDGIQIVGAFSGEGAVPFDLLPGRYHVRFGFAQKDRHPFTVEAGRVMTIGSAPRGRLAVECRDGVGGPARVWVGVRGDDGGNVTGAYPDAGHVDLDLLPGSYLVQLRYDQPDEERVEIVAGRTTPTRSRGRGRLAVNVLDQGGTKGVRSWVQVEDGRGARIAAAFSDDIGRIQFDLLAGSYRVTANQPVPMEAVAAVAEGVVTSCFVEPRPAETAMASTAGGASFRLDDDGVLLLEELRHGQGVGALARLRTQLPGVQLLTTASGDSEDGSVEQDLWLAGNVEVPEDDGPLPPPTVDSVRAYLQELLRQGAVGDAGELPESLRDLVAGAPSAGAPPVAPPAPMELDRAPLIEHGGSLEPCPGRTLTLFGDFRPGSLRILFARSQQDESAPRFEGKLQGRQLHRVTVTIPIDANMPPGRYEVWGELDGVPGPPVRLRIYEKPEDMPASLREKEKLVQGLFGAMPDWSAPIARLVYQFTRKRGRFTIPIGSRSGEVDVGGTTRRYRWVVFADVELRRRFKEGRVRLRAALYPGRPSIDGVAPPNPVQAIDLVSVDMRKDGGKQVYDVRLWSTDDHLEPLLGALYDKDTRSISLRHVLGLDLQRHGVELDIVPDEKRLRLGLRLPNDALLNLHGDGESLLCELRVDEQRTIAGRLVSLARTHELADDVLSTVIRLRADASPGQPGLEGTLRFRDPDSGAATRELGDFSADTRVTIEGTTLGLSAAFRDRRIESASATFNHAEGKDRIGLTLGYQRSPDGEHEVRRWSAGVTGKTELFDGRLDLEAGVGASMDLPDNRLRAIEFNGHVEVGIDKAFSFHLGASGTCRPTFGAHSDATRWSLTAYGKAGFAGLEAQLGFTVDHAGAATDERLELSFDVPGLAKSAIKVLGGEKEKRIELFRRVGVEP